MSYSIDLRKRVLNFVKKCISNYRIHYMLSFIVDCGAARLSGFTARIINLSAKTPCFSLGIQAETNSVIEKINLTFT